MAEFYSQLTQELQEFIKEQKIFFTATVPKEGRINLSPKGIDTFRCLDIEEYWQAKNLTSIDGLPTNLIRD